VEIRDLLVAVDGHGAARGLLKVVDAADERRLARPGGADDDELLAGGDGKVDVLEDVDVAEVLVQVLDLDHVCHAFGPLSNRCLDLKRTFRQQLPGTGMRDEEKTRATT